MLVAVGRCPLVERLVFGRLAPGAVGRRQVVRVRDTAEMIPSPGILLNFWQTGGMKLGRDANQNA